MTDDAVPTHVAGTLAAHGADIASTTAAGASSVQVNASAGGGLILNKGDIFSIAGNTQTYTVLATVSAIGSASKSAVRIDPPLAAIASANSALDIKGDHVVNLVFHRDAFAFANRPLVSSTTDMSLGNKILSLTDPQTGITLRLEVSRQYKQVVWEFDLLWGAQLVRPQLAARLAG